MSRTNGKTTIVIFAFFFSGGDFSLVPSNIENSPRGKSPIGVEVGLERYTLVKTKKAFTP